MAKRALVGGVSAKLTQFSWWGGGEWPDHMGSLEVDEPEIRRNISFSKDNLENWERTVDMEICPGDTLKNDEKKENQIAHQGDEVYLLTSHSCRFSHYVSLNLH